jgi:hypothetical protein
MHTRCFFIVVTALVGVSVLCAPSLQAQGGFHIR